MASDSLDTNIILRYIIGDVPGQFTIADKFFRLSTSTHHIEDLAISEIVYVLTKQYGRSRSQIVNLLNFFLARFSNVLEYNHDLTSIVFPFYLNHPKLSFNDCCLSAYAETKHHEPLWTFDQKFARQADNAKLLK